jgi:hypothetical protein
MSHRRTNSNKHPAWNILGILVVGLLGLAFSHLMYENGADPLKDGLLIGLIAGLTKLWDRFS